MIVAILGAESTGKSDLAAALRASLADDRGIDAAVVGEYLREWCEAAGRTPRVQEQRAIADEQRRRIETAAAAHAVVVADTTPLMTAVYSEWVFGDRSLYAPALRWQRQHVALTLVTALDMPWQADGMFRDGAHVREPVDTLLRAALAGAGVSYCVLHGDGARRRDAALAALRGLLPV
jgi:nicotinamide riboside kinase